MEEGHIFIEGVIDESTTKKVKKDLEIASASDKLVVHIASPGGSVYDGYKIYHLLKGAGKKIKTIIEGEAQSMATFISLAGDEIEIKDPSIYMIHNPSQGVQGDADKLQGGAEELRMIEDEMSKAYSLKTGISVDEIKLMMKKESRLTASEAKSKGFADKISNQLKAVAIGQPMEEEKLNAFEKALAEIKALITKKPAGNPNAVSLEVAGGGMVEVDGEEGDLVGKTATVDGEPAEGDITLADGRILVAAAGVVTEIRDAVVEETAEQKQQKEIDALKSKLQQAEAAKIAATQAAEKVASDTNKAVEQVAVIEKELVALKSQTIGASGKPETGFIPHKVFAMGPDAKSKSITQTRQFINQFMPWMKQYYSESEQNKLFSGPSAVSILETDFNYTYPGILTTDIFYKPTLQAPALSDFAIIDQGIKDSKKYNLITQLDKILKPYTGCTRVFNNNQQDITNTTVQTKEFNVAESWCKDDFTDQLSGSFNVLAQEWLKSGNRSFDPTGTPISSVIDTILKDALQRDVFRRFSFGAADSSDADYNQIDGIWTRNIDSSGASNYCVTRAGTALGTAALSAGNALTFLEQAYAESDVLLKNATGAKFFVTRSIWDNYYNSLIGSGAVTEAQFQNLQNGLTNLTYKGRPVVPVDLWDVFLAETDNPLNATTAHLIMLTVKENHILGVEQSSDLNKIEGWYERKDRKFYYESDMKFGYNYLHCDLTTVMY
jgi:ATP-dependent Clp protease, protease subunit